MGISSATMADAERKRLPAQQPRGLVAPTGCAAAFFVAFGLPFMAAGTALGLLARGVIPWGRGGQMPDWLVTCLAALFFGSGVFLATKGVGALIGRARMKARRERYPGQPWRVDYPWDPAGASHNPGSSLPGQLAVTIFMTLLLAPFNYFAFYQPERAMPFWASAVVVLFDVVLVFVVVGMVLTVVQQAKYGRARLAFQSFPFFLGDTLTARLGTSRAIGEFKKLTFTLRCIQELTVTSHRGTRTSIQTVCDQLWKEEVTQEGGALREGNEVTIRFDLPEGDYGTHLAEPPARYWELAVVADTPGLDFSAKFLVPVYARV
jgi:hypothetical protein